MLRKHEIRAIYDQGVEAVGATIRQLYEVIEVEDERAHKLVASATAAQLQKIERLSTRSAKLEKELANKVRQVHQLKRTVKDLTKQLKEARSSRRSRPLTSWTMRPAMPFKNKSCSRIRPT